MFGRINPPLRRSITFDNDTAFAQHGLLRTMRDMTTWFCDAYASWLPIPTKPPVYNGMIVPRDSWMMPPPVTR